MPPSETLPEISPAELASARPLIELALAEDFGERGDLTSLALIPAEAVGAAQVVARQAGVLAGWPVAEQVFAQVSPDIQLTPLRRDGERLSRGTVVADAAGPVRALLAAERTVLNFLTHLSGVATLTRRFADAVAGSRAVLLDTRKTLPGYRRLEKYAVRCGGGVNHRLGLFDAVLIKDNHLAAWTADGAHSLAAAIAAARAFAPEGVTVEVEVDSLDQLRQALAARPDVALLDNMTLEQLREAVALRDRLGPRVQLEASGGVTLETIGEIASTGVDRISVGALTHSAPVLDLAFDWKADAAPDGTIAGEG
jgi:nicotinate-nucleotide pyrophosphorylase (carboxylating)